ncbi:MAG: hypothetical protein NVSMB42_24630 [Herpetosiphon sp.]
MKKGITLSVKVYLEGEQAPADDFAAHATASLREQLGNAFRSRPAGLTLQIKQIKEQDDDEDEDVTLAPTAPTVGTSAGPAAVPKQQGGQPVVPAAAAKK